MTHLAELSSLSFNIAAAATYLPTLLIANITQQSTVKINIGRNQSTVYPRLLNALR